MKTFLISIAVGTPLGVLSCLIGEAWARVAEGRDWRGWYLPEATEQEKKDWGLD